MHQLILDEIVAVCERRRKGGDFPVDPQPNAEHMEDAILDLTTKLAAAEEKVKELEAWKAIAKAESDCRVDNLINIENLESRVLDLEVFIKNQNSAMFNAQSKLAAAEDRVKELEDGVLFPKTLPQGHNALRGVIVDYFSRATNGECFLFDEFYDALKAAAIEAEKVRG